MVTIFQTAKKYEYIAKVFATSWFLMTVIIIWFFGSGFMWLNIVNSLYSLCICIFLFRTENLKCEDFEFSRHHSVRYQQLRDYISKHRLGFKLLREERGVGGKDFIAFYSENYKFIVSIFKNNQKLYFYFDDHEILAQFENNLQLDWAISDYIFSNSKRK